MGIRNVAKKQAIENAEKEAQRAIREKFLEEKAKQPFLRIDARAYSFADILKLSLYYLLTPIGMPLLTIYSKVFNREIIIK